VQTCGRSKKRTFTVVFLFLFQDNKAHLALEINFDKLVIVGESNNAGIWGWSPQPPEVNGGSGAESPMLRRFLTIFSKKWDEKGGAVIFISNVILLAS